MAASILYGVLVVGGVCLVAVGGLALVQRLVPNAARQKHNDVAGFIYAVLGVIYAVLLALVVIAVWEDFGRARETVESEANATAEIFWLANRLPEPEGHQVEELADARRMRLVAAHEGIPAVLWVVLVMAGVAAVGFTYLFGLENTWAHRLMVMALAGVIGLVLFTIGAMEHPFSGGARIGTEAFDLILERFETSKLSNLR